MLCYRCGSYNADNVNACTVCGAPLSARRKQPAVRAASRLDAGDDRKLEAGHLLDERYRVGDPVGQGTTGGVWRARDERTGTDVALKVMSPNLLQSEDDIERFVTTVERASALRHPHTAPIVGHGRDGGHVYYAMPYLEGLTLRDIIDLRLENGGSFRWSEILPLLAQLTQAIDAWGSFGYHGAIRAGSVLVLPDLLKLTALPHLQGLLRVPFVVAQQRSGSIHYLAPEARRDNQRLDVRADVYSVAVLFTEMLTGIVYGASDSEWRAAQSKLPKPLIAVLGAALAESPERRFTGGHVLFERVADAIGNSTIENEELVLRLDREPRNGGSTKVRSHRALVERQRVLPRWPWIALSIVSGVAVAVMALRWSALPVVRPESHALEDIAASLPSDREPKRQLEQDPVPLPPRVLPADTDSDPEDGLALELAHPRGAKKDLRKGAVLNTTEAGSPADAARSANGCPADMVKIGQGRFVMGAQGGDPLRGFADLKARALKTRAYCIDRYEYPNREGELPRTGLSWSRARRACGDRGKRLCSEVEWEKACKGPKNVRFPFGQTFEAGACNVDRGGQPQPAGSYASCRSGYGVVDMAGNVAEWTETRWSAAIPDRVVKGGTAKQAVHASRCAARINETTATRAAQLGFRCCRGME